MANQPIAFDAAFNSQLAEVLTERHSGSLADGETLSVWGEMSHGHIMSAMRLDAEDGSYRLDLAVRLELEPNRLESPTEARAICLDALDAVFMEWLESERLMRLPPLWDAYAYEPWTVRLRGGVTRPSLEAEADRWLAMAEEEEER